MRERLLASSMICSAALAALAATPALAQAADEGEVAEVVVTGTRIPSPNLTSVSPVTSIGSAEIKAQGITRIEDMINSLPQAFAAQGSSVSNGSNGIATVNLRSLGAARTVVLIDGRRLQAGNPTSAANTPVAADLNFIPASLVERVDILTGGASAVYGADAVAGVVNFVMLKNFEGVRLDAQYSIYQHENDNTELQNIILAKRATAGLPENYTVPKKNVRDGEASEVTLAMGVNAPDGQGNITAYATYRHVEPVFQANRDYSACTFNSGAVFACGGSGTAYPARVGGFVVDVTNPAGNTFRPFVNTRDVYNFGPVNYYQRPDDRYGLGAFAHYEITPWAEAYADVMFMEDSSTYQIAPGGIFVNSGPGAGGAYRINCDNPLMSAQQAGLLCGANAGTSTIVEVPVARRNTEGGGRQGKFTHTEYRYVVGLRGELAEDWRYDAFLQYGSTSLTQVQTGYFVTPRINNALLATRNAQGQIVCQSVVDGTDPACVPYNIFQIGGVTPEALNYLQAPAFSSGNITERIVNANVVGLLPEAIKSPLANDRVGVS
ncbi:MAG: TonB-dependent receptor plug domain-containing protein, partial [Phenylobacterium sp.]